MWPALWLPLPYGGCLRLNYITIILLYLGTGDFFMVPLGVYMKYVLYLPERCHVHCCASARCCLQVCAVEETTEQKRRRSHMAFFGISLTCLPYKVPLANLYNPMWKRWSLMLTRTKYPNRLWTLIPLNVEPRYRCPTEGEETASTNIHTAYKFIFTDWTHNKLKKKKAIMH